MPARWRENKDPLYRGDALQGVRVPQPTANASIVRHVLYLDGPGRQSPYLSTSEEYETAERFAGARGSVYFCSVPECKARGVMHRSRKELLQLLRGRGKGDAKWPSAMEVLQARRYVEEWHEHLVDFRNNDEDPASLVIELFERGRP